MHWGQESLPCSYQAQALGFVSQSERNSPLLHLNLEHLIICMWIEWEAKGDSAVFLNLIFLNEINARAVISQILFSNFAYSQGGKYLASTA